MHLSFCSLIIFSKRADRSLKKHFGKTKTSFHNLVLWPGGRNSNPVLRQAVTLAEIYQTFVMLENIEKCKVALTDAVNRAKSLKEMSEIDIADFTSFMNTMPKDFPASAFFSMKQKIMDYQNYPEKLKSEIQPLLNLLDQTSKELNSIISPTKSINRFGDKLGAPNPELAKLILQGFLNEESEVFYLLENGVKVSAKIIKEGYLKLDSNGKLFSSPTTASSYVCEKPKANGWKFWFTVDTNQKTQPLEYFRLQLS